MEKVQNQDSQEDAEKVPREVQTNTRRCRAERKKYGKSAEKVLREHRTHKQVPEKCGKSTERVKKVQKYEHKGGGRRRRLPPLWGGQKPPKAPSPFVGRPKAAVHISALFPYFPYFFDNCWILVCFSGGLSALFSVLFPYRSASPAAGPYLSPYFFRIFRLS